MVIVTAKENYANTCIKVASGPIHPTPLLLVRQHMINIVLEEKSKTDSKGD